MTQKRYDKLAIGHLAYLYKALEKPQIEGTMGIVLEIREAGGEDPPHILVETLVSDKQVSDEYKKISYDYAKIGSVGRPRPQETGKADVKLLFDPAIFLATGGLSGKPPLEDEHRSWNILAVAGLYVPSGYDAGSGDRRWALVEDHEWSKRRHWLPINQPYSFAVGEGDRYHTVCLEGISKRPNG